MSLYKELAQSTYNKLSLNGFHKPSNTLENLKRTIENDKSLLSSQTEQRLYIESLIERIKVEKIDVAQNQKWKFGYIILDRYDEILELYNWLKQTDYTVLKKETLPKINSLNWLGNDEQLEFLYNALINGELIKKNTDSNLFKALFSSGSKDKRVQWTHTTRLLDYLFKQLHDNSLINCPTYQAVIDKNGLFENKREKPINANDLSVARTYYMAEGSPKGSEIINSLIENIKNIKSS